MNRRDIVKSLISEFNYGSYLEIGVYRGFVIDNINIKEKDGVDPSPLCKHNCYKMTSDEFFKQLPSEKKYDLIFIDGFHDYKQVLKDVFNSLKHLSDNGTIALHDCNPPTEWHQRDIGEFTGRDSFNGTVWKAFVEYRFSRKDLVMFTIDCDWGVGIIRTKGGTVFEEANQQDANEILTYHWFAKNRKNALNLIGIEDFEKWIKG